MEETLDIEGVVILVQARMSSLRLPGKVLLPLGDSTVLEQVIRRVEAAGIGAQIVVAIPDTPADRAIRNLCDSRGIPCYAGSEKDVLDRLLSAAQLYEASFVVRCLACDPLIHPRMLWASIRYAIDSEMDLVTVGRLPVGSACEAMPIRTLSRIRAATTDPHHREQVTTYALEHRDEFECATLPAPLRLAQPWLRLRLETEADYWFLKRVYEAVPPGADGLPAVEDVIEQVIADPELLQHSANSYAVVKVA